MLNGKYPLFVSVVLGIMAGLIAYSAITARTRSERAAWQVKYVLCAARDLAVGVELSDDDFETCELPAKFVTASFIPADDATASGAALPLGQKLIVPLMRGDPMLYSNFEAQHQFPISEAIANRYRAMSLDVTESASVSQLIKPNDHVDILGAFRTEDGKELISTTVLEDVLVLAAGRMTGTSVAPTDEDKRYNHVTVLVQPREAELLLLASQSGTLAMTLRNPDDASLDDSAPGQVTKFASLLDRQRRQILPDAKPPPSPAAPDPHCFYDYSGPGGPVRRCFDAPK